MLSVVLIRSHKIELLHLTIEVMIVNKIDIYSFRFKSLEISKIRIHHVDLFFFIFKLDRILVIYIFLKFCNKKRKNSKINFLNEKSINKKKNQQSKSK